MSTLTHAQIVEIATKAATEAAVAAVNAALTQPKADAPAKVTRPKAAKAKANARTKKAPAREVRSASHTFIGERVGTGSRKLTRANREAFIAAHAWAKQGWSVAAIRSEVAAGARVNKGWNVAI